MTVALDARIQNGRQDLPLKENGAPYSLHHTYMGIPDCEDAIRILKEGKTLAAVAAHFEIGKPTLKKWRENFPELNLAIEAGLAMSEKWWMDRAIDNLEWVKEKGKPEPQFRTEIWKHVMIAEFGSKNSDEGENKRQEAAAALVAELVAKIEAEG